MQEPTEGRHLSFCQRRLEFQNLGPPSPFIPPLHPAHRNPQQAEFFLSASGDCGVTIWDVRLSRPTHPTPKNTPPNYYHYRRNPQQADIFLSASGDCTVKIWDLRQPRPTLSLAAHQFEVLAADWCKYNDCILATGSVDKSIKVGWLVGGWVGGRAGLDGAGLVQ